MKKRIAFAWITEIIDFNSMDEAINFVKDNALSGWRFVDKEQRGWSAYLRPEAFVSFNGNDNYCYTVEVQKPYRNYNFG